MPSRHDSEPDTHMSATPPGAAPAAEVMEAAQFRRFGDPAVLEVGPTTRPSPGPGEVLVRVQATGVNPHDAAVRSGKLKIVTGRTLPLGVGLDFAGHIVAAGPPAQAPGTARTPLPVGAAVWGMVSPKKGHRTGAAAQYVVVPADRVALMPARLSPVEAASMVTAGTTALRALRDVVGVRARERVLVRGGAGSVGAAAIQLARASGAHVTAIVSDRDAGFAVELGAHEVLTRSLPPSRAPRFDVIVDTVGTDLLSWRRRLARGGRIVTVAFGRPSAMLAIAVSAVSSGGRRVRTFSSYPDRRLLDDLTGYVDDGVVQPVVGTVYPLAEIAEAHRALTEPGRRGKLVLTTGS